MKIKSGFELRCIAGENLIVTKGISNVDFSKIISMNDTAAYLWREIEAKGGEFTPEVIAELLVAKYEVSAEVSLADAKVLAASWIEAGIAED